MNVRDYLCKETIFFCMHRYHKPILPKTKTAALLPPFQFITFTLFIFAFKLPEPAIGLIEVGPRLIVESHVAIIFHDP